MVTRLDGHVVVEHTFFSFQAPKGHWIFLCFPELIRLAARFQLTMSVENGILDITLQDRTTDEVFQFRLISGQEINILVEVFIEQFYQFVNSMDCLDVGANIGASAIYMARFHGCKVIAFEPVPETFRRLVDHVKLNKLESLVECHCTGLSDRSGSAQVLYDPNFSGSASEKGIYGSSSVVGNIKLEGELVDIQLTDALNVFETTLTELSENIFLKLDCEGAEHRILAWLKSTDEFKRVKMIATEVHATSSNSIREFRESLVQEGFFLFERSASVDDLTFLQGSR
ncbi:MAG: FkbM family methyltransferase [Fimbriimonas sp.]|nr:FkbM family methyltransferase [Fimbriimonas sp.]